MNCYAQDTNRPFRATKRQIMRAKQYKTEIVAKLEEALDAAPPLPPKTLTAEEVLKRYESKIRELHEVKNYTPGDIAALLKSQGFYIPVKSIKNVLGLGTKTAQKRAIRR